MSSVTINELVWDFKHNTMQKELIESCYIEIVPRKIVEMIIEKCEEEKEELRPSCDVPFEHGEITAYTNIREYAESLLKQFEEDDKGINVPDCIGEEDELPFE